LDLFNSTTSSKLHFSKVLYYPEAGYILVLIGQLNNAGFSTLFANGKCIIYNASSSYIAEVSWNGKGLYKLVKEVGKVNIVSKSLILALLYQ